MTTQSFLVSSARPAPQLQTLVMPAAQPVSLAERFPWLAVSQPSGFGHLATEANAEAARMAGVMRPEYEDYSAFYDDDED